MKIPRCCAAALILTALLLATALPAAAEELLKPGAKLDALTVGTVTYHQVVVRSYNVRTLMITHASGMASIHLRDLPPELQARFNYDPAAEAAADEAAKNAPPPPVVVKRTIPSAAKKTSDIDRLLQQFGQPATIQSEINLRPKYAELGIGVRDQGRRPSCAIFAIVSALEYQNARMSGKPENFSEDYLIWATEKTVQRTSSPTAAESAAGSEDADSGFTLTEVVNALRAYGIPPQSSLPNNAAVGMKFLHAPSAEIIKEAREHQKVFVHELPGRDAATRINNLVHALNDGIPVAIGLAWPNYRSLRTGYLSGQKPMQNAWHAVTVVGYHSNGPTLEDTYFIFKNSWGSDWGQNGYGTVTYGYLKNYLNDAVVLEVQPG